MGCDAQDTLFTGHYAQTVGSANHYESVSQTFKPSKSQKRLLKKSENQFQVQLNHPVANEERLKLYNRYQREWHQSPDSVLDQEQYAEAFVASPVETLEMTWRDTQNRLVGVGLVDVLPEGLSTVYFFWEPELAHAQLGTLSVLKEIELTRKLGKALYYMGFLVRSCQKMVYKSQYVGAEVWCGQDWKALPGRDVSTPEVDVFLDEAEQKARITDETNFPFHRAVRIFSQRG